MSDHQHLTFDAPQMPPTLAKKVLGVSKVSDAPAKVRRLVQAGIPASKLARIGESFGLSQLELARLLGLNAKTISRLRQSRGRLGEKASDRIARLVRVFDRTTEVLGNATRSRDWLHAPSPALAGETPLSWLDTDAGTAEVFNLLGRIEHGVFS